MARGVHYTPFEFADLKTLTVLEQPVELRAVGVHVLGIEDLFEDALHFLDVDSDGDAPTDLLLQVRRGGEVIGMGVRFKMPLHLQVMAADVLEHPIGCFGRGSPRLRVVVEHAVDHGGCACDRAGHDVCRGERVGIKERLDARNGHQGGLNNL